MKLHDLRPAEGSRTERTRVGRGIAAGKGKTAGRGTKGQKARAGGSIPPWFEGGQTPLHVRIPKLRGFRNRGKVVYEIVNVGDIDAAVQRGALETQGAEVKGKSKGSTQITVNQDILRAVGLVRSLDKPLKILGAGELSASLFVVADAFTGSARTKIEAAGGSVSVLEVPTRPTKAIGVDAKDPVAPKAKAATAPAEDAVEASTADDGEQTPAEEAPEVEAERPARQRRAKATAGSAETVGSAEAAEPAEAGEAADAAGPADSDTETTDSEAEAATTPDDAATSGDDA
jgi:large subunit ribosomal protein L15